MGEPFLLYILYYAYSVVAYNGHWTEVLQNHTSTIFISMMVFLFRWWGQNVPNTFCQGRYVNSVTMLENFRSLSLCASFLLSMKLLRNLIHKRVRTNTTRSTFMFVWIPRQECRNKNVPLTRKVLTLFKHSLYKTTAKLPVMNWDLHILNRLVNR